MHLLLAPVTPHPIFITWRTVDPEKRSLVSEDSDTPMAVKCECCFKQSPCLTCGKNQIVTIYILCITFLLHLLFITSIASSTTITLHRQVCSQYRRSMSDCITSFTLNVLFIILFPTLSARIHKANQVCVVYKVTKAILKFDWVALFKVLVVSSKK